MQDIMSIVSTIWMLLTKTPIGIILIILLIIGFIKKQS